MCTVFGGYAQYSYAQLMAVISPQSTTPSHSLGANYQNVLALMKAHSPLLCGAVAASRGLSPPPGKRSHPSASRAELKTLLAGLEEEFGRLTL